MTEVHAYLARIKDQEKDVIAVPDGVGRALCVSSDKHWTLTREWDELHIIAPLHPKVDGDCSQSEAQEWAQVVRELRRERDTAATRAEQMEKALAASRDAHQRSADAHMEWKARAEQAESEIKPSSPLRQQADSWMRIVNHPAISQSLSEKNKSYSDQVFERITWLFEAAEDARESNPAPAVSRADIEKVVAEWVDDAPEIVNEVWALVSGADPAVYVIRESDLPTVQQDEDGEWYPGDRWDLADDRFIDVEGALEKMHRYAAIARAIEAKEDPIMVRTRELLDLAYPGEYAWTGAFETCRRIAEAEARMEDRHVDQ